jgi:hypothetical protein
VTCNYGFAGDNEVVWFAESPAVTAGSVRVLNNIDGDGINLFNDLAYGSGGQDRGFPSTGFQGTWPWHGVFTADEGGTLTRWDITVVGSAGGNCTAVVYASGATGAVYLVHP